jgi:hypothetical protein
MIAPLDSWTGKRSREAPGETRRRPSLPIGLYDTTRRDVEQGARAVANGIRATVAREIEE